MNLFGMNNRLLNTLPTYLRRVAMRKDLGVDTGTTLWERYCHVLIFSANEDLNFKKKKKSIL